MNLNRPPIKSGPLTLAELDDQRRRAQLESITLGDLRAARKHSSGSIYDPLDFKLLPSGTDSQGRHPTRSWRDHAPSAPAPLVDPEALRVRARGLRTLCALCLGSWIVPVTLLAIVSRCSG